MSLLLPHRQLLLPKKPFLVGVTTQVSSSSPITLTLPRREVGVTLLAFLARHAGGTATPGTPTGWASVTNTTADPEYRIVQKICDGTEASTTTSATGSATSLSAIVLAFTGADPNTVPSSGTGATGTSTAPDAPSYTPAVARLPILFFTWTMWNGDATVSDYPGKYSLAPTFVRDGTNGGQAVIGRYGDSLTEDAGAFTITASVLWGARSIRIVAI